MNRRSGGITLLELMVVFAIIALLIALLLPAIQTAREAARRARCEGNLRQLGMAIYQYHDAHGCLPMGRVLTFDGRYAGDNPPCTARTIDRSILVGLLPFLEQSKLFDGINHQLAIFSLENVTVRVRSISVFACPSDPLADEVIVLPPDALLPTFPSPSGEPERMALTSYTASFGSLPVIALPSYSPDCIVPAERIEQSNGCFNDRHPYRFAAVSDGLSQTAFMSERAIAKIAPINEPRAEEGKRHGWWVSGNLGDTLFTTFHPPNPPERSFVASQLFHAASSMHPGGVHVLCGDNSVRFVSDSIDSWPYDSATGRPLGAVETALGGWTGLPPTGVWQALSTRAGGEATRW